MIASPYVDPSRIILYGHSLGGAVALHLAAENLSKFMAVIIENTFMSIPKMANYAKPAIAWATFVVTETWDNESQIRSLRESAKDKSKRMPDILFITGENDNIVPPIHMNELWRQAQEISHIRPEVKVLRFHMDQCSHTCYGIPGYYDGISKFYYSATGEKPMQALALPPEKTGDL
jgi:hypothetical protein